MRSIGTIYKQRNHAILQAVSISNNNEPLFQLAAEKGYLEVSNFSRHRSKTTDPGVFTEVSSLHVASFVDIGPNTYVPGPLILTTSMCEELVIGAQHR